MRSFGVALPAGSHAYGSSRDPTCILNQSYKGNLTKLTKELPDVDTSRGSAAADRLLCSIQKIRAWLELLSTTHWDASRLGSLWRDELIDTRCSTNLSQYSRSIVFSKLGTQSLLHRDDLRESLQASKEPLNI